MQDKINKSIYRKFCPYIYFDERFRALSSPKPNGQTLFTYLLTGPDTIIIPGVLAIGQAALAENLGWEIEDFRGAFAELEREGLAKADWKARVVWIPQALFDNPPASINVIIAWRNAWNKIPSCSLKNDIFQYFKVFMEGLTDAFRDAFLHAFKDVMSYGITDAIAKASVMPSVKASSMPSVMASAIPSPMGCGIQEQEQEQKYITALGGSPSEGSVRETERGVPPPKSKSQKSKRPKKEPMTYEDFLSRLRKNKRYAPLDLEEELFKAEIWMLENPNEWKNQFSMTVSFLNKSLKDLAKQTERKGNNEKPNSAQDAFKRYQEERDKAGKVDGSGQLSLAGSSEGSLRSGDEYFDGDLSEPNETAGQV